MNFDNSFTSLLNHLRPHNTLVVVPWGNVGDEFLRRGMCHLFRSNGITYQSIHISQIPSTDFSKFTQVAWGGGGNVCGRYQTENDILTISKRCKEAKIPFICLPQSIEGVGSHLFEFDLLFLRESFSLTMGLDAGLNCLLCPDLSLAYPTLHQPPAYGEGSDIKHFFRADSEAIEGKTISDPRRENMTVEEFLEVARSANTIHTDLMHLGIAALKQGRKVVFYEGNWHKIHSMYHTWLHNMNCEIAKSR
jgi:exopolysaccharide biosynthesis predicted pyruvyltransferase EpsI